MPHPRADKVTNARGMGTLGIQCWSIMSSCLFIRGLKQRDDDGSENITKKRNFAAFETSENFIASIWNCSIRQMQATFPGVEFSRALSMFK